MNTLLQPLAAGFKLGVALRRAAYRRGWLETRRLSRPVISVGNLTVGGTGKTPLVALVARRLVERGFKPAILTRGYGRRRGAELIALEPCPGRTANPRRVGDEPALLARKLPEVPIVIGADRYRAGRLAEERFQADAHLLDDGFQHWALARDLDIVLVDVTQEFSDSALLPAGRLREPISALARAQIVVLTRVDLADPRPVKERVRQTNPQAKIFHSHTKLCALVDVATGRMYPPGAFQDKPVYAFCGIGNPKAFFADLKNWGFSVETRRSFGDHHIYGDHDVAGVLELMCILEKTGPKVMVTTEKDAINLPPLKGGNILIVACIIETEIHEAQAFEEAILECLPKPVGQGRG